MTMTSKWVKVLITILFLYIFYIYFGRLREKNTPNSKHSSEEFLLYSYGDLQRDLCMSKIVWTRKSLLNRFEIPNCPESEQFVSVAGGARSGNLMWAYASVMAIAKQTGLKPYVPDCVKKDLEHFFEELTIPTFQSIVQCPVKIENFVQSIDQWRANPQTIILPRYLTEPEKVIPWIPNIWQEFSLKESLRDSAQQTLKSITNNLPTLNYTFVAVHVRRTDYKDYLLKKYGENLASLQFFLNAMAFFKRKYSNVLFIMVSDDPQWCIKQFAYLNDVFVISRNHKEKNGPALDMAVMVACNHTIFDYGTFGTWGAILAGGEVVFYDMIQNSKNGSMQYNTSWHLLS